MAEKRKKNMPTAKIATIALSAVSVGLLTFGALTPPIGEIHNSIIMGVGEIILIMALWILAHTVIEEKRDAKAKLQIGNASVSIETENDEEEAK